MEDKIAELLLSCSKIDFGDVVLKEKEKKFCHEWNRESILFCKSLPESTQTDALLFLVKFAKTSLGKLDLFKMYYVPAWSIIFWLIQTDSAGKRLTQKDEKSAKAAHFMAMLLHALDDHLTDRQLPVTHLSLLLRSHAWMIMNNALNSLAGGVVNGRNFVRRFINDYYSSIRSVEEPESLDCYCEKFKKQMATWLIVPFLMTKKMTADSEFSNAVQTAYGSFGVAWRLLDDIKDIEEDLANDVRSAVHVFLPEKIRNYRRPTSDGKIRGPNTSYVRAALKYILQNKIIEIIEDRICKELSSAASILDNHGLPDLASEFRCLHEPLTNSEEH